MKTSSSDRRFLDVNELAKESGESVAVWRKRIFFRQIPYVKFGRNVRVKRENFEAFAAKREIPALSSNGSATAN
jgi:hypothetical protein